MAKRINVIIKRPEEPVGHVISIYNTLADFQRKVGGNIETLQAGEDWLILADEEGILKDLKPNIRVGVVFQVALVGTIIAVGVDGENFCSVPFSLDDWKRTLERWGNIC